MAENLENILQHMHTTLHTRFSSRSHIAQQLKTYATVLPSSCSLTPSQLTALDGLAIELKQKASLYASSDASLDTVIARIDDARSNYRSQGPLLAFSILTQKGVRYETRFAELHAYIASGKATYDDIALSRNWLAKNSYVQRRARTNAVFADSVAITDYHLTKALTSLTKPKKSRFLQTVGKAVTAAAMITSYALLAYSALPLSLLG